MSKLQIVQNAAARIIAKTNRRQHITPVLCKLHWLPVQYRVTFKILLFTYKALNDIAPGYLKELLHVYVPGRSNLRSSSKFLLTVPRSRLVSCGDKSFSVAAPSLWNSLPLHIRLAQSVDSFKKLLKTYLFQMAFE